MNENEIQEYKNFKDILLEISDKLHMIKYKGDLSEIGNEIGFVVAKYIDTAKLGYDLESFIIGIKHGVSLVDGTHDNPTIKRYREFTGLFDKNNQPLKVGDLFKSTRDDNFIFRVWKVTGGFASNVYVPIWQKNIIQNYPFPLMPLADEQTVSWFKGNCYIIGNIDENPEFLNLDYLQTLIDLHPYKNKK